MHYHIYCKEKSINNHYIDAISEYTKRLQSYCDISLHISPSIQFSKEVSLNNHNFISITTGPSSYSSEEFSIELNKLQHSGKSFLHILIGYTNDEIYEALQKFDINLFPTDLSLTRNSLPSITLTLLFYEQIYRAYTILQGKTYHK